MSDQHNPSGDPDPAPGSEKDLRRYDGPTVVHNTTGTTAAGDGVPWDVYESGRLRKSKKPRDGKDAAMHEPRAKAKQRTGFSKFVAGLVRDNRKTAQKFEIGAPGKQGTENEADPMQVPEREEVQQHEEEEQAKDDYYQRYETPRGDYRAAVRARKAKERLEKDATEVYGPEENTQTREAFAKYLADREEARMHEREERAKDDYYQRYEPSRGDYRAEIRAKKGKERQDTKSDALSMRISAREELIQHEKGGQTRETYNPPKLQDFLMKNFLSSKYSLERENRGQYLQPRISDREDDRGKSGQWSSKDGDGFDHVRRIIRGEILGSLDSFDNRSKVVLHLNWSPRKFLESQEYKESPGEALAAAITITGSGKSAQATTTEAYLTQFWPESGAQTLRALQDSMYPDRPVRKQERGKHIHASKDNGMGVTVTVTGPLYFVADVGEQLAWIGSALQTSSFKRVTYYVPLLSDLGAEEIDMSFYVQREEKMQGEHAMQEGVCWQGLFRSPVVVQGFPHTQEGRLGLDIPLNMMAALIKACRVTEFDGRLFIKGFSAILFPTKLVDNCITWHLVYNEDGSYISYLDKRIEALQNEDARKIGLSDLAAAPKNVVGWCAKAENFTGSLDAHYPVSRSACEEPRSGWIFEKLSLSGGQYINLGLSFCMGVKDKPLHLWYRPTYEQQVLRFSKKYVLLYDVDDRRGWLVNGTSALLHLVIASWKYELSTAIGDRFLSKIEDLKMVGEKTTADRAFAILIDRENMALPVLPGKRTFIAERSGASSPIERTKVEESVVTFSDRVEEAIHYLEKAFTIQEEKMYSPGHEVTMPISTDTLPGYDFAEICESQTTVPCRFTELRATSKGWMAFLRKIQAVALFGREFGDLIRPTSAECSVWKDMPSGKDYIAVNVLDMKDLIDRKALSLEKFDWHCPERPFECSHDAAPCHRAQALVPKSSLSWLGSANNVCGPKILEGNERGAIILGGTGGLRPHRNSSQRRSS